MRGVSAVLSLVVGVGLGAWLQSEFGGNPSLRLPDMAKGIASSAGASSASSSDTVRMGAFAPQQTDFGFAASSQISTAPVQPAPAIETDPVRISQAVERPVADRRQGEPSVPAQLSVRRLPASMPTDASGLTREIKTELKRIGCLEGYVDTDWNALAKRSMQSFLERVNARLPIEQPDPVLLSLLRNQPNRICDVTCNKGQTVDTFGRCVAPITAQAGAPKRGSQPVEQAPTVESAATWKTTTSPTAPAFVQSAPRATVSTLPAAAEQKTGATNIAPWPAPPGRMAIGGPVDAFAPAPNSGALTPSAVPGAVPPAEAIQDATAAQAAKTTVAPARTSARSSNSETRSSRRDDDSPRANRQSQDRKVREMFFGVGGG